MLEVGTGAWRRRIAGMLLADNGARVVKVEPPRRRPAAHRLTRRGFLIWNRGKESLVADLTPRRGARSCATRRGTPTCCSPASAPGSSARGASAGRSSATPTPALVHLRDHRLRPAAVPYAALKAYEGVVAASAGCLRPRRLRVPDGPIFYDAPWAALGAAHHAVAGILAALIVREQTGRGQHVDATLANGISALDYFGTMHWQHARAKGDDAAGRDPADARRRWPPPAR